jgi:Nucleotidyltransferase/DNA polymerase involved in DNA repair
MDSFFASVEVNENPSLRGLPVVVGADPKGGIGRGVVSTASYEARRCGIHSGMPISRAYRLCPNAVFLPVNFPRYIHASERIMRIARAYGEDLEPVSIDEAYLDVTAAGSYDAASRLGVRMKEEIRNKEHLTCSVGIGPSRVVAKIASDMQKPDGLTVVPPERVEAFFRPLPVRNLPGIGRKTERALSSQGITTIGQLADSDVQILRSWFGMWGVYLQTLAHGQDIDGMRTGSNMRSIGREITFETDTDRISVLETTMDALSLEVYRALVEEGYLFRTLSIKVRDARFQTHTRSRTLDHPLTDHSTIQKLSRELLQEFLDGRKIRLLGLRLSHLIRDRTIQATIQEYL